MRNPFQRQYADFWFMALTGALSVLFGLMCSGLAGATYLIGWGFGLMGGFILYISAEIREDASYRRRVGEAFDRLEKMAAKATARS